MTKQGRRRFTPEYREQAVARLSAPGAAHASVSAELGVTATQLKTWRLELEAAGSALAIERQRAEAAELVRPRLGTTSGCERRWRCYGRLRLFCARFAGKRFADDFA